MRNAFVQFLDLSIDYPDYQSNYRLCADFQMTPFENGATHLVFLIE
jgi:hypothetical protein